MKKSQIKKADYTAGEYFKVSVVKISVRSDEVRGCLSMAQLSAVDEKLVLRKTQNKFEKCLVIDNG